MVSLKQLLGCIGQVGDPLSVVKDFFGYRDMDGNAFVPKPIVEQNPLAPNFTEVSVLEQAKLLQGTHFHLNIIRVGDELFEAEHWEKICFGVHMMRYIYGKVGIGVGRVHWGYIPLDEVGYLALPATTSDYTELTNAFSSPVGGMDLFVCVDMDRSGRTGPPWAHNPYNYNKGHTCDKDEVSDKHNTGSVANLCPSREFIGNTFAHEIGHYFGLGHFNERSNFMHHGGGWPETPFSGTATGIESWQGDYMKRHCFMLPGC